MQAGQYEWVIDQVHLYVPDALTRDGTGSLAALMRQGGLRAVFQPVVDLKSAAVHAHEALIRGPEDSPLHRPEALLRAAQDEGLLYEFELFCLQVALRRWGTLRQPGRLFLNISANALSRLVDVGGTTMLAQGIRNLQVSPRMVVLEITEHERVDDMDALGEVSRQLQSEGLALALDDFGDGRSSLRLWSQLKPDIVKIDKYFSHDIHQSADRLKTVQALLQIADVFGTSLVAEGIEHEAELRVIRDLGITYGQGWFLGRPEAAPRTEPLREAGNVLRDTRVAVLPEQRYAAQRGQLRHLSIIHAPTLSTATSNDEAAALFHAHPGLHAMAVLESEAKGDGNGGERPVAILNRQQFMDHYATLYFREIHGRKSCIKHANREPRLIERNFDIEELVGILTSQDQRYLNDGFIVTDNGRYVGLGTGDQLVRSVTELRLEAARHANPLTSLPGNIPISLHMQRLLDSGGAFTVCYLDLDNFKPYNDHYGYWRGDEMIRLLARLAVAHSDPQRDFVGHVGGDDFMILFQSEDWRPRSERIIAAFARQARDLYDEEGRTRGGVEAEDRQGVRRFFPCTTVSIGAVRVAGGDYRYAEELATKASLSKHEAKLAGGLHVMVDAPARAAAGADADARANA
ncbi:GGDEF domain-containing protein [Hylemonella gracilis]|uniref:GGDEF domain-containing protein n=2 Tax=Hylemonella gracilis TaxID=80880 RepID=A0A4P6UM98_9BURK|nr:GGDEF domain-containing protein [Hylemonella gracilis]